MSRRNRALDDHVRLLPTPSHTPHHVAVCFGRHCDDAVMTGDVSIRRRRRATRNYPRASMSIWMRPPRRLAASSSDIAAHATAAYAARLILLRRPQGESRAGARGFAATSSKPDRPLGEPGAKQVAASMTMCTIDLFRQVKWRPSKKLPIACRRL